MALAILAGSGKTGRSGSAKLARDGSGAGRAGHARFREPAGMVHRRSRHHGSRLRDGSDLHHQYRARPRPHHRELRRARGDRLDREAGQMRAWCADADRHLRVPHQHRTDPPRAGRLVRLLLLGRPAGGRRSAGTRGSRRADRRDRARGPCLHHLHQRHRRGAARRAPAPRRDPVQRGRLRRGNCGGFWLGRGSFPLVPAAEPRLRAFGRAVLPDRTGRPDLLRRGYRQAGQEHRGGPPDHHGRRPAPVRGAARAHHQADRPAGQAGEAVDGPGCRHRRAQGGRETAFRRCCAGQAGRRDAAAQDPPALRRANEGDGLGRCAAQSGNRHVLFGDGPDAATRLRPDRGGTGHQLQPAQGGHQDGHRRPAAAQGRRAHRRGWRDTGAGRAGDARLLAQRCRHAPDDRRWLAAHRRHRPPRRCRTAGHHRPQEGYDRQRQGRQCLPAKGRIDADAATADRAGHGLGRPAALPRRPDRPRCRMGGRLGTHQR